ncbi:MAG: hypothetical protein K2M97_07305 [Muribaculaceae bacterium]|nr:hypothetical protein [Muribaculaceae bacterium]
MKKSLQNLSIAVIAIATGTTAAHAIDIIDDTAASIYAIGAMDSNRGVFTMPTSGNFAKTKISGTTYIQYYTEYSGGTFTDKSTVYGTKGSSNPYFNSYYAFRASADNNWDHDYYTYRKPKTDGPGFVNFPVEITATDMTYDPTTKTIYGWFWGDNKGSSFHLGTFVGPDLASVEVTPIGSDQHTTLTAIATDSDGQLWGIEGASGSVFAIDKTNGELTWMGTFEGVTATGHCQSAAFDPADGALYWCAPANDKATYSTLYRIDIDIMTIETVYDMDGIYNAIYIPAPETDRNAPGTVTDLSAVFNGKTVDVTFTAPTKTYGDRTLTGELSFTVTLDGAEISNGKTEPGATVTRDFAMADGTHTIAVRCSNAKGSGEYAEITFFAGFDTPGAVRNPSASADGYEITVAWELPMAINGGMLDKDAITYTVTRMPEMVEIASGIKATSIKDVIDNKVIIAEYYYTIAVDGGTHTAQTNAVVVGKPHTVPYREEFSDMTALSAAVYKTILGGTSDSNWALETGNDGNRFVSVSRTSAYEPVNYIFTPPISLKGGVLHTLSFKLANSYKNIYSPQGTNLTVVLSSEQTTVQSAYAAHLLTDYKYTATSDSLGLFRTVNVSFTPEKTGTFYFGFIDSASRAINTVAIDDITVFEGTDNPWSSLSVPTAGTAVSVSVSGNTLSVVGAENSTITVADILGRIAAASSDHGHVYSTTLPHGVYVISISNQKSIKITL